MREFVSEISRFLRSHGFECSETFSHGFDLIVTTVGSCSRHIIPIGVSAGNAAEAEAQSVRALECIRAIKSDTGEYPLIITEDLWYRKAAMTQTRLLAHLEIFHPVYARNCEVRRIEKDAAKEFLEACHSYGFSSCRYCYGLFIKRHTGHNCLNQNLLAAVTPGTLVAVATFSNARRWKKGEKEIRSYEWTRYASLPSLRISGGMGRALKAFIKDIEPDDIMSYADLEWSEGAVYEQLGFIREGMKDPVYFTIDRNSWTREAVRSRGDEAIDAERINFRNFGSAKYRMKLTEYE